VQSKEVDIIRMQSDIKYIKDTVVEIKNSL